jgi:dihydroflavonol-4-reductase
MRALVTGATGCVGANVAEAALAAGYEVRAMRRTTSSLTALDGLDIDLVTADLMDPDSLTGAVAGCDLVFHCAGIAQYWRNRPHKIYTVNVMGTRNLLRAAMAAGIDRFVLTSSVAVLGIPRRPGTLLDERADFNLPPRRFHYGHSKVLGEAQVQWAIEQGLDAVIVNPATVIGQRDVHFVGGEILRAATRGWTVVAPPGGMGAVDAKSVGVGHVLAAERGRTGERYILNGTNLTHRRLMTIVAETVGKRPPVAALPRTLSSLLLILLRGYESLGGRRLVLSSNQWQLSLHKLYFDGAKASHELGFESASVREAVESAWRWYRARGLL